MTCRPSRAGGAAPTSTGAPNSGSSPTRRPNAPSRETRPAGALGRIPGQRRRQRASRRRPASRLPSSMRPRAMSAEPPARSCCCRWRTRSGRRNSPTCPGTLRRASQLAAPPARHRGEHPGRPRDRRAPQEPRHGEKEDEMTGLRATARLQFHKDFTIDQACELVPYFESLGISHLYASPLLKSRPGSTHGYDIVDHHAIDPELGGILALQRLVGALRDHGMGLILDIVPNHMGVGGADNAWWLDVLEWGRASPYADYFDIDWDPPDADAARPPARAISRRVLRRGAGGRRSRRCNSTARMGVSTSAPTARTAFRSTRANTPPCCRSRRAPSRTRSPSSRRSAAAPACASAPPRRAGRCSGGRGASGSDRGRAPRLCRDVAGRPGPAAPAARTPELPARLVAGGGGRDQLAAVLRHQRPRRHPRRGSRRCSTTRTTTSCASTPRA